MLEAFRDEWLFVDGGPAQQEIARRIQSQAFQDVPVGSCYQPTAYRANLSGMLEGLILFTNVKRG